jgi:predicted metal-dependent hydrolase
MEATEPQKTFYQGVLQISVALYHLSNQNWRGATILLGEGINRLRRYLPTYATVNVEALLEQSMKLLVALQQAQPEQVAEWAAELAEARWQDDRSSQTVSTSSNCQMTVPTIETVN